jgi:hypothetical protein
MMVALFVPRALCRASAFELFRLGYEMGGSRSSGNTATKQAAIISVT